MVHQVQSEAEFAKLVDEAKGKLILVDFYATWCGPCMNIAPFIQELSEKHKNVVFLKVDVDEQQDLSAQFEVNCMPTFVFLKNGEKVDRLEGASKTELESLIKKHA